MCGKIVNPRFGKRRPTSLRLQTRDADELFPEASGQTAERHVGDITGLIDGTMRFEGTLEFGGVQGGQPVDMKREMVIHPMKFARAPGGEAQDGGAAQAPV